MKYLFRPLKILEFFVRHKWSTGRKNHRTLITILCTGCTSCNRALHQIIRMGLGTCRQRRQHSEVQMLSTSVPRHRLEVHHTQTSSVLHLQRDYSMYHTHVSCTIQFLFTAREWGTDYYCYYCAAGVHGYFTGTGKSALQPPNHP